MESNDKLNLLQAIQNMQAGQLPNLADNGTSSHQNALLLQQLQQKLGTKDNSRPTTPNMQGLQGFMQSPLFKPEDSALFRRDTPIKKPTSTNISGNLTPREGNGSFKPKMAQPVVLVNDQSPKSNKAGVTPKGTALDSLLSQIRT
jgi:hypothetical protein